MQLQCAPSALNLTFRHINPKPLSGIRQLPTSYLAWPYDGFRNGDSSTCSFPRAPAEPTRVGRIVPVGASVLKPISAVIAIWETPQQPMTHSQQNHVNQWSCLSAYKVDDQSLRFVNKWCKIILCFSFHLQIQFTKLSSLIVL